MRSSLILFAGDLADEGYENVLDRLKDRAGVDGVTMACNYHHSRDVLPHNPRRKVLFMLGGVYFRPDTALFAGLKIQPDIAELVRDGDPLRRLTTAAGRKGLAVKGWTNNMHSTVLASRHPDCAVENVFGDIYITSLCPANPDVRAYVRALAANLAQYDLEQLLVESVSFMPFDHGYHHERTLVPISATTKFALSLCFCPSCAQAGRRQGVDVETLRDWVRREAERALNGDENLIDGAALEECEVIAWAQGEMQGYVAARKHTVTSLVAELAEAAGRLPLSLMEWSGGLRAVGGGMKATLEPGSAADRAWQDGTDIPALARVCNGLSVLGYVPDAGTLRHDLAAYRRLIPKGKSLSVALRPMAPDCASAEDLAGKLRTVMAVDGAWADFYHYGFMRLSSLDWIREALRKVR